MISASPKFAADRPFANPDVAARKLVEIANDVGAMQDDRIYIERVNAPFLAAGGHRPRLARRDRARHRSWLAVAAREPDLSEIHRCRCGDICLVQDRQC